MTGADFTGVDIDLLADYVGGALQGTPDQARVADLIVGDPAWQEAYTQLSDGMAEVGDALHGWGAAPEPMPADVVARLEAALAEMGGVAAAPENGVVGVRERSNVVDFSARRSRRALRRTASFAAAAAAVGLAGLGISHLASNTNASSSGDGSSSVAAQSGGFAEAASAKILASGTDYHAGSLLAGVKSQSASKSADAAGGSPVPQAPPTDGVMSTDGLAGGLTRLRPTEALQMCLDAIGSANRAGPLTVQTVDYARFDGKPALVVRFTAGNGSWAWVSGPRCGLPGVGADTTYSVWVG